MLGLVAGYTPSVDGWLHHLKTKLFEVQGLLNCMTGVPALAFFIVLISILA